MWNPKLDRCCAQSHSWFSVCYFSKNQLHAGPERALLAVLKVLSWHTHTYLTTTYDFTAKVKDVHSSCNLWMYGGVCVYVCAHFGSKAKGNIGRCSSFSLVWTHKPFLCLLAAHTAAKESLQVSSWAPSVIKEACTWCCHRMHKTLCMRRKGYIQLNFMGANAFN